MDSDTPLNSVYRRETPWGEVDVTIEDSHYTRETQIYEGEVVRSGSPHVEEGSSIRMPAKFFEEEYTLLEELE